MISRRSVLASAVACVGVVWPDDSSAGEHDLAVIVHPSNSVHSLREVELEAIFLTTRRYWSASRPIVPFNLPPRSEPRAKFDRTVLRMDPDEVSRFWIDRRIRGGAPPPRQVSDPGIVVRLVARLPAAIGYVPMSFVAPEVRVIAYVRGNALYQPR